MVDNRTFFSSKGIIQQAPLFLYKISEGKKSKGGHSVIMLFEPEVKYDSQGRTPNIAPEIYEKLAAAYKKKPAPEQVLYYCYAVLYSNTYRKKYAEFLKIDFPRIPFTGNYKLFLKMAEMGEELGQLHLLESKRLSKPIAKYHGKGEGMVEKVSYDQKTERVYINPEKYFDGVSEEVWEYHIGGYQVMGKYLKDRKGRKMDNADIYCKIATAIYHTLQIQKELDKLYSQAEKKLIP